MSFDPTIPASRRVKTGGRKKGTPNKSTAAMREAIFQVFAELQAEAGRENGHFLDWARDNATDFYKLMSRLLPRQVEVPDAPEPITAIRRYIIGPGDPLPPTREY